jgi:hypothetical protein
MISISLYGRLGNHLWQYAVCRTVAEKNGYDYHIPRNFLGNNLFNCSLGVDLDLTTSCYPHCNNHDGKQAYDPNIFKIKDFTRLDGYLQTEKYILNNKSDIMEWFKLKSNYNANLSILDDNTCVINFRGGDYKDKSHVFLHKKYYYDSITHIKQIKPNIKFIVITDDVEEAKKYFPEYDAFHFGIINDYAIVNSAKYLIIANSTFSWWAAWLNNNSKITIAPKFWLRHNISEGWWMPADSLTTGFHYVDRNGKLSNYDECLSEITDLNYQDHY